MQDYHITIIIIITTGMENRYINLFYSKGNDYMLSTILLLTNICLTLVQDPHKAYDINSELASHCSLHSCISSNYDGTHDNNSVSYSTSVSTDTLYWDPNSETSLINASRPQSGKSRKSDSLPKKTHSIVPKSEHHVPAQYQHMHQQPHPQQHHHRYHHMQQGMPCAKATPATAQSNNKVSDIQMQPAQYLYHKPKSWDNLTMKAFGGYAFGYGYLDKAGRKSHGNLVPPPIPPKSAVFSKDTNTNASANAPHILVQQSHSMPRKNIFGRYSTDVENYAPPPSQFVHSDFQNSVPGTYVTKSTENLLDNQAASNTTIDGTIATCNCTSTTVAGGKQCAGDSSRLHKCSGYYSHLPTNNTNNSAGKNGAPSAVSTVSEVTRL